VIESFEIFRGAQNEKLNLLEFLEALFRQTRGESIKMGLRRHAIPFYVHDHSKRFYVTIFT